MSRAATTRQGAAPELLTTAALTSALADLLAALDVGAHELSEAIAAHRDAIRSADPVLVRAAAGRQEAATRVLAGLDHRRRELAVRAAASVPGLSGRRADTLTLRDLAASAAPERRDELLSRAVRVRERTQQAARAGVSLREAALSLVAHMEGIMKQVSRDLSHAGTYTRRGVVECAGAAVVSTLDIST